jgi:hypothetical protein
MAGGEASFQKELEAELERLKKKLKLSYELKVRWVPNNNSKIFGEVRDDYIYIYDENREVAFETLKHEFLDYAISKVIEPYKEVTNRLIAIINDDAYKRKEKVVQALSQLLNVN